MPLWQGHAASTNGHRKSISRILRHLAPTTLYGQCKNEMQQALAAFSDVSGLSSAWGRIFFPYGPHEYLSRLVPSVTCALLGMGVLRNAHPASKLETSSMSMMWLALSLRF